jgi:excisionase family DNA binding protein
LSTEFGAPIFNPDDWISQAEAARLKGVSRQAIWKLIKKGRLRNIHIGGHTLVFRKDIESFQAQKPGRHKTDG